MGSAEPPLPALKVTAKNAFSFCLMVAQEIDKAFPEHDAFRYMREVLPMVDNKPLDLDKFLEDGVIKTIVHSERGSTKDRYYKVAYKLGCDLMDASHYNQNGIEDVDELSDLVRRMRDGAEAVGLPNMDAVSAYFTLLFR